MWFLSHRCLNDLLFSLVAFELFGKDTLLSEAL